MPADLDIRANRRTTRYSTSEYVGRLLWVFGSLLFRLTPRPFYGLRNCLLRLFGARVGRGTHIHPTARITLPWNLTIGEYSAIGDHARIYNLGPVRIGDRSTISQYAHLCAGTHDYEDPSFRLLKPPIAIGDEVWVCADAFVGPGVTLGDRSIVAAAAVVVRDIPPNAIVAGNPARIVKTRA